MRTLRLWGLEVTADSFEVAVTPLVDKSGKVVGSRVEITGVGPAGPGPEAEE